MHSPGKTHRWNYTGVDDRYGSTHTLHAERASRCTLLYSFFSFCFSTQGERWTARRIILPFPSWNREHSARLRSHVSWWLIYDLTSWFYYIIWNMHIEWCGLCSSFDVIVLLVERKESSEDEFKIKRIVRLNIMCIRSPLPARLKFTDPTVETYYSYWG